ncbi:MAG: hypothetical protein Q8906_08500 [Bacillota bacterium]|nr:hypothetical protein [Bacillota bacterium]
MSDYQQFLSEREKIDFLMLKGYRIEKIKEDLNGSYVEFLHPEDRIKQTLHVATANGRKYFSSLLIRQKRTTL